MLDLAEPLCQSFWSARSRQSSPALVQGAWSQLSLKSQSRDSSATTASHCRLRVVREPSCHLAHHCSWSRASWGSWPTLAFLQGTQSTQPCLPKPVFLLLLCLFMFYYCFFNLLKVLRKALVTSSGFLILYKCEPPTLSVAESVKVLLLDPK